MKTNFKILLTISLLLLMSTYSCVKKDFDAPVIPEPCDYDPGLTANITIEKILELYNNDTSFAVLAGNVKTFPLEMGYVLEATVISSDEQGNFYKEIYLVDETDALIISIDGTDLYNDYNVGQKVMIKLSGLHVELDDRTGSLVIGMGLYNGAGIGRIPVSLAKDYIYRKSCAKDVEPIEITIPQISNPLDTLLGRLVKIKDVQFSVTGVSYADGVNQLTINLNIEDADFNTLILRTSGYASFAGNIVPSGSGDITGVLSKYDSDYQLFIRDTTDVEFNNNRLFLLSKNFDDGSVLSGGWSQQNVTGNINWGIYSGTTPCASISNYVSGSNLACETWLISPSINLSQTVSPILAFRNACNYTGDPLIAYISTDYDGTSAPSSATWIQLTYTASTGGWAFVNSGNIDIAAYKQNGVYIAFKYTGTSSSGKTWEIDDIVIKDLN